MKLGVVGSGKFKDKNFVIKQISSRIDIKVDIIVSGHSPRNKRYNKDNKEYYDNVDIWAEDWANEFCWNKPIIHPAKEFIKKEFFKRNKKIAQDSDKLLVFINKGQYKSGAWNTVGYFISKFNFNPNNLMIYNERHEQWCLDELPMWVRNRIRNF